MRNKTNSYNTKTLMATVLKDLLKIKDFDKVTVSEIVKISDINRNTFYYHFENLYDLLIWTLEEEAIHTVKSYDMIQDMDGAIDFVLEYIEKNKSFLNNIVNSVGESELARFLDGDFRDTIEHYVLLAEEELDKTISKDFREFLVDYHTQAISGILVTMIRSRSGAYHNINNFIQLTIRSSILAAIENY